MESKQGLTNSGTQFSTFTSFSASRAHVVNKKSAPPRMVPITPFANKPLNYRGMKSYSQAEIMLGTADTTPRHSFNRNLLSSATSMMDADAPAEEFERIDARIPIEEDASARSDSSDEVEAESQEEEKQSVALPTSHIGSVGERGFARRLPKVNLAPLSRPRRVLSPLKQSIRRPTTEFELKLDEEERKVVNGQKETKATAEESKLALKGSKAPDPFEDKYSKADVQLNDLIYNTSSPDNPLHYLRLGGTQSRSLQRSYRNFVVALFESIFVVKDMLGEAAASKNVAPKLSLKRPPKLKSKHSSFAINSLSS